MTYKEACEEARRQSIANGDNCSVYVVALLTHPEDETCEPMICGYGVSDWFDGSIVARYQAGIRKE